MENVYTNKNIHAVINGYSVLKQAKHLKSLKYLGIRNSVEKIQFLFQPIFKITSKGHPKFTIF